MFIKRDWFEPRRGPVVTDQSYLEVSTKPLVLVRDVRPRSTAPGLTVSHAGGFCSKKDLENFSAKMSREALRLVQIIDC